MDHANHEPGTVAECHQCLASAYEPAWYALLLRLSEAPRAQFVAVPDVDDDEAFGLRPSPAR